MGKDQEVLQMLVFGIKMIILVRQTLADNMTCDNDSVNKNRCAPVVKRNVSEK